MPKHITEVLSVLEGSHEQHISVELRCIVTRFDEQGKRKAKAAFFSELRATMSAIIYGPRLHFKKIGDFLEECDICLQDPLAGCGRNVRYRNPHKYSGLDPNAPWTIDCDLMVSESRSVHQDTRSGYMDDFVFQGNLPEAPIPQALRTELFRHQRQGLYFMLQREHGWSYTGHLNDIWKATTVSGLSMFQNTVNDDVQLDPPRQFRGGLLFDDMGLGKTLTVIALAASDLEMRNDLRAHDQSMHTRCTLVIVPPQLLGMWEEQLSNHVRPDAFRWCKHHGSRRLTQLSQLKDYDLVLTTYNTVAAELKCRFAMSKSVLLQAHWHRIVLDEAQEIRDPRTQAAKAIRMLNADRRWAVSGTPIQNHLSDFRALLQYLRATPYDDPVAFERDITHVWKTDHERAIRNLKHIIMSLALRRSRDVVELPPRTHSDTFLNFSLDECALYEPLEIRVTSLLNHAKNSIETTTRRNALQGFNALRLVCNFGTLSDKKHLTAFSTTSSWSPADAQEMFNSLVTANEAFCTKCSTEVVHGSTSSDIASAEIFEAIEVQPTISACGKVLCANCSRKIKQSLDSTFEWCGCFSACPVHVVEFGRSSSEVNHISLGHLSLPEFPTKTRALISDLQSFPNSKSVVFSSWRTTLDLCAAGLALAKIPYVRFDGQVNDSERVIALASFKADPNIKVILFTISCGAVGLDLTAADRAYLMEPQWNPTVENQAFARIHRMGQTKPVTTIRFIMNRSYEEHVIEVQKQKKTFSDFLLNGKRLNGPRGGWAAFETFRRLISRR